jgi:hypothetical protein
MAVMPLESQKVVAVMSMITVAGCRLMTASRFSRSPGLLVMSISSGAVTRTCSSSH